MADTSNVRFAMIQSKQDADYKSVGAFGSCTVHISEQANRDNMDDGFLPKATQIQRSERDKAHQYLEVFSICFFGFSTVHNTLQM